MSSSTSSSTSKGYQFTLVGDTVTAVYEVEHGRAKLERMDSRDSWRVDGDQIIHTETAFGKVETHQYADANQDGLYQQVFELEVRTGANVRKLETYRFAQGDGVALTGGQAQAGDSIASVQELGRRGWQPERIGSADSFSVALVDGDALVLHTQLKKNGALAFEVFRDDDGDGLWSAIASGSSTGEFVTAAGQIDLVGMAKAGCLSAADALIG